MSAQVRQRNPRGEGQRLRGEILEAALALTDSGERPAPLTLRGVARAAGISAPSIYDHFPNLASLTDAVRERSFDQLREAVAAAIAAEHDNVEALLAAGRAYARFGWRHRARFALMFDESGYPAGAVETYTLIEELIARLAADRRSQSTNPQLDAWLLWAALHGVVTRPRPSRKRLRRLGAPDRRAMLETLIRRLARLPEPAARSPA